MAQKKKGEEHTNKPTVNVVESTKTEQKEIFVIVNHNGEFMIALGNNVVSKEKFDSREKAIAYIDSKPWELILNSTAVMMAIINEQQNKQ